MASRGGIATAAASGLAVGAGLMYLLQHWRTRSLRSIQLHMRDLGLVRAAEPPADISIEAWGGRPFPLDRKDTALVLIDMQTDFLSAEGRVGKHYDKARLKRMDDTIEAVEDLLLACRQERCKQPFQ
eukprot:632772-Pleurochrysis_carterae.AAC.4